MMHLNKEITKELIKTTDSLRRKYKALRNGREEFDFQLEETFKPITNPLKELVRKTSESDQNVNIPLKKIKKEMNKSIHAYGDHSSDDRFITPDFSSTPNEDLIHNTNQTPKTSEVPHTSRSNRGRRRNLLNEFIEQIDLREFNETPREYVDLFINRSNKIDNVFGIHMKDGRLKLGNKNFNIIGDDIEVNKKIYKGSVGLFELIFKKIPNKTLYNIDDLKSYKDILQDTSAHRRHHSPKNQKLGHKGLKYKEIISKLFENSTPVPPSGSGLMNFSKKRKEYIFWDDPNELVVRLRLLLASHHAGHNNQSNEIISIIEELKEANIIE